MNIPPEKFDPYGLFIKHTSHLQKLELQKPTTILRGSLAMRLSASTTQFFYLRCYFPYFFYFFLPLVTFREPLLIATFQWATSWRWDLDKAQMIFRRTSASHQTASWGMCWTCTSSRVAWRWAWCEGAHTRVSRWARRPWLWWEPPSQTAASAPQQGRRCCTRPPHGHSKTKTLGLASFVWLNLCLFFSFPCSICLVFMSVSSWNSTLPRCWKPRTFGTCWASCIPVGCTTTVASLPSRYLKQRKWYKICKSKLVFTGWPSSQVRRLWLCSSGEFAET